MLRRFRIPTICIGSLFRRRLKPPQKTNRLFGQALETLCQPDLPQQLSEMLMALYKRGPTAKQIFRRSPQLAKCQEAKMKLNTGIDISFDTLQLTVTAALLKDFLRNLPDCLLTCHHYREWLSVIDNEEEEVNILIKSLVEALPVSNQLLLRHIICVLRHICDNCVVNEMTSHNMAVCVGQCLLWPPNTSQHPRDLESARKVIQLVQQMIDDADEIFGDSCVHLYSNLAVDGCLEESYAEVADHELREFATEEGLTSLITTHIRDDNASALSCWTDDISVDEHINRVATKVMGYGSDAELFNEVDVSLASYGIEAAEGNVELRNSQGSSRATDSGFVDDDSAVTGTLSHTDFLCNLSAEQHALEGLEQSQQEIPIDGDRLTSEELCSSSSKECGADVESNESAFDRSVSDNGFVLRRRNCITMELLCQKCGLRTMRSSGPKARRRLSLPVCIRICRCRSGMTANGSDLFPTRIIDNTSLLPTVFEDDMLAKGAQALADRMSTNNQPFRLDIGNILPASDRPIPEHSTCIYVGAVSHPGITAMPCCDQPASRMIRSPPSYAEAILHKALRQGNLVESEKLRTIETLGQLNCGNLGSGVLVSSDPTLGLSKCQREPVAARLDVKIEPFAAMVSGSSDVVTSDVPVRIPPPAYDIATRYRYREGTDGSTSVKTRSKPDRSVANRTNIDDAFPIVTLQNESSDTLRFETAPVQQTDSPSAATIKSVEHSVSKSSTMPLNEITNVPCSSATTTNDALMHGSVLVEERTLGCQEAATSSVVESDVPRESLASATVTSGIVSAIQINHPDLTAKQVNDPPSTEPENRYLRRRKRAAKRRTGHSSSDTQIEAAFGKSMKPKHIGVRRSFSDSHTTASSLTRSCTANKENISLIDFRRLSGGKRSCPGMEKNRVSNELALDRKADSNNNDSCSLSADKLASSVSVGEQSSNSEVVSKRQVLRVKNQDWYRELVREYSVPVGKEQTYRGSTDSSRVMTQKCLPSAVTIEGHHKVNTNRLGSGEQRRLMVGKVQRPISAMTSRELVKQLSSDGSCCKERIAVTWSVSKLREKYSNDKDDKT